MKIDRVEPYLNGEKFSNGLQIDCASGEETLERLDFLVAKTKGKSVLHVGFTDHKPLIEDKIKQNRWLHKRLLESCARCIGLDINRDAIDFVKNELKIEDVFYHDIINDEPLEILKKDKFDYAILGEVLEHTDNPVEFLKIINEKYAGIIERIIITVPNAYDYGSIRLVRKNIECINTDHRYWFTPYTLAKVVHRAGLRIVEQGFCNPPAHRFGFVSKFLKKYTLMSETLYMIAELDAEKER